MTNEPWAEDDVLFAFQLEHPVPTPADVAAWTRLHPEHRAAIMQRAASLREMEFVLERAPEIPAEKMELALSRGRSVTMDLLHKMRSASAASVGDAADVDAKRTLRDLLQVSGRTLPDVAREIDAGRGMLTDILAGRTVPPIGARLKTAFAGALGATLAAFDAALDATLAAPTAARAKADGAAAMPRRGFEEVVRGDATMSEERKAYWLAED